MTDSVLRRDVIPLSGELIDCHRLMFQLRSDR